MFDTLKFARAMRDGGQSTPEQAERLSDALSDAISGEVSTRADLEVTEGKLDRKIDMLRADLEAMEARLGRRIDLLRADFDSIGKELRIELKGEIRGIEAKIEAAKADTIKWVVGIIGFQSVAIIGAAIVLARILAH